MAEETLQSYPLQTDYKSTDWNEYALLALKDFSLYDKAIVESWDRGKIQELYEEDHLHPISFDLINSYKDKDIAEKVGAYFLFYNLIQENYEKSLIGVYDSFEEQFPESVYLPYLDKEVDVVRTYYKKIDAAFPEGISFIENQDYNSLNELMSDFKGTKYYVDVWATWCGPCKQEFKHNKELEVRLKEYGYDKFYISLDKEDRITKWKQDIKYFDLFGKHLRGNQAFFEDFEKVHSTYQGYIAIPQYLIINENGEIVTNNAPRPSQLDKLKELL